MCQMPLSCTHYRKTEVKMANSQQYSNTTQFRHFQWIWNHLYNAKAIRCHTGTGNSDRFGSPCFRNNMWTVLQNQTQYKRWWKWIEMYLTPTKNQPLAPLSLCSVKQTIHFDIPSRPVLDDNAFINIELHWMVDRLIALERWQIFRNLTAIFSWIINTR